MKIEEAIAWIHSRLPFGSRPGLDRVEALLEIVGHPYRRNQRKRFDGYVSEMSTRRSRTDSGDIYFAVY